MAFRPAKCSSCGKDIQVPDDQDVAVCMYCGASIAVRDVIQITIGANAENLLALARTAGVAGNYIEAYDYYNRVLEIDPSNTIAWYGKGEAAGWMSNLKEFRFSEMLVAFDNALRFAANDELEKLKQTCANTLNSVATACYKISRDHFTQFLTAPNVWTEYVPRCRQIISLYEAAHRYTPDDRQIIENIIHLCKDNIEGAVYNDPFNNNASTALFLGKDYEKGIREILVAYAEKLQKIDPNYVSPNPVTPTPKKDGCFVVTATVGNEAHPAVVLLRLFRDELLVKSKAGVLFIAWYYKHGPAMARRIENSMAARTLSYAFVVVPAVCLVTILLWLARLLRRI